ncbi:response regulator [Flavobacterium ustbae]|uniref:response regulator n=1 Tax=Flavobacterium ustbae TaxID=2488790 RepID=UPI000F799728|nr:response regulator [Flavobacterium ustbae]
MKREHCAKIIYMDDDDEDDRMLFSDAMQELELDVELKQAPDGLRLLDMLAEGVKLLPEIVFLDINIPSISGLECLEEIKNAEGALSSVKVVMLSTSGTPENIEMSYGLGADLYALKPSSFQGLKELLYDVMTREWDIK